MCSNKQVSRLLVCGTNFGRVYLKGIEKSNQFSIAGILSKGSEQSKQVAKEYGVPLYTDIKEIDKTMFDAACVVVRSTVVGGKGSNIANQLLNKGISVLQEHPVHYNDLVKSLKIARENNCRYQINSFYPHVSSVHKFIKCGKKILDKSTPLYIDASCSIQVLFPMIDILGKLLNGFRPWKLHAVEKGMESSPFSMVVGEIKGIPVTLKVQNQIDPKDPDNNGMLLHRIVLGTSEGSLILNDSNGDVLWNPQMYVPHNEDGVLDMYGDNKYISLPVTELISNACDMTYKNVYEDIWPLGIQRALSNFEKLIKDKKAQTMQMQYQLTACQLWKEISDMIGKPQLVESNNRNGSTVNDI